jgi:tetratricopeptide (TPR) repeat protein
MASARIRQIASEAEVEIWEKRAKQEAGCALKLHWDLAEAHEALAAVYRHSEFDWERALTESQLALDLNPNLDMPHLYRAFAFYHLGLFDLADEEARAAVEINTENRREALVVCGFAALHSGRYTEAVAMLEEAIGAGHRRLAQAYYYQGQRERAETMQGQRTSLATFLATRGARARAEALLRQITDFTHLGHHTAYDLGVTYAQLGDRAKLRNDPEFQRFIADLKKTWEAAKKRYGSEEK